MGLVAWMELVASDEGQETGAVHRTQHDSVYISKDEGESDGTAAMTSASAAPERGSRRGGKTAVKVLLVEDDEIVAAMYRARLLADGHTVIVAGDGEEGLRMALEEDPGFIFLDLRLPKLNGLDLLARLRTNATTREIPVIVLTNMSDPELSYRGNALGVVEYMIKAETTPMQLSMRLAEHQRRMEQT